MNKATVEARELCGAIIDDPAYRRKLHARAISGDLPPGVEAMLWYYRFGKPKERVDVAFAADPFEAVERAVREANGE